MQICRFARSPLNKIKAGSVKESYCHCVYYKQRMQPNLEAEEQDILHTIDLTAKLEQSLRKLLTKKKSFEQDHFNPVSPPNQKEESNLISKVHALEQENRELYIDNQELSREIIVLKEQLRECKKQMQGSQKYLQFLQSYNDDLKKELLFWMKGKKEKFTEEQPAVNDLMSKIIKLRQENEDKEFRLLTIGKTIETNAVNSPAQSTHKQSFNFDLPKIQSKSLKRKKSQERLKNECTSCSYKSKSKGKQKDVKESSHQNRSRQGSGTFQKSKNLRKWHNNYISACDYAN